LTDVIEALEDLLEAERTGLLAGDLDRVLRLAGRKQALLSRLPDSSGDLARLDRLRRSAARNAGLLAAAAQGVRAAAERVRNLIEGPAPLTTYDGSGRRQSLASGGEGPVRRA
jgi:flagellar biosynthesis/type III secretory pathway chaperone